MEVYFSRRHVPANAPPLSFNNINIETNEYQKHLGLTLDSKLSFSHHLDEKIRKANKGIGLINKLGKYVPRKSLLTLYKSYIRPHLDYGDIIYDHPGNATFVQKLESIQYNACLDHRLLLWNVSRKTIF